MIHPAQGRRSGAETGLVVLRAREPTAAWRQCPLGNWPGPRWGGAAGWELDSWDTGLPGLARQRPETTGVSQPLIVREKSCARLRAVFSNPSWWYPLHLLAQNTILTVAPSPLPLA